MNNPMGRQPIVARSLIGMAITASLAGCGGAVATPIASHPIPVSSPTTVASPGLTASPVPTGAATPSESPSHGALPAGRIAFGERDSGASDFVVYTALPDGSGRKQLLPGFHECPKWSPDGKEILVAGGSGTASDHAFATVVSPGGSVLRELTVTDPTLTIGCAVWSPDGKQLAGEGWDDTTAGREGIYLVSASDGGRPRRITSPTGGAHDIPGSFSPDGKQIEFVRVTDDTKEIGELRSVDVAGGDTNKLTEQHVGFGTSFSPDGRSIVADSGGVLLVVDVANPAQPRLVSIGDGHAFGASWSPDGSRLVFSYVVPGTKEADLYTSTVDGTDLQRITTTGEPNQDEEFGSWAVPHG